MKGAVEVAQTWDSQRGRSRSSPSDSRHRYTNKDYNQKQTK